MFSSHSTHGVVPSLHKAAAAYLNRVLVQVRERQNTFSPSRTGVCGRLWESLYVLALVSLNKCHSWTLKHGSAALAFKYLILSCLWGEGDVIYTLLTGWIVVETSSSTRESLFLSQCHSICLSLFIHYVHSWHRNSEWLWGAVMANGGE